MKIEHDKDSVELTPVKQKYTLAELLAASDLNSPDASQILKDWENLVPVGKEITD